MSNEHDEIIRSYFDFLIVEYGFDYQGYDDGWTIYISDNVIIECRVGRSVPSMRFKMPLDNENISVSFGIVLEVLGIIIKDYYDEDIFRAGLEKGIILLKTYFWKVAETIINQPETWWLDSIKLKFDKDENMYLKSGQDVIILQGYRKYYQYIKSKDPTWNSRIPVPDDWNP